MNRLERATELLVIDVQQGLLRESTPIYRAEPPGSAPLTLLNCWPRRR